MRVRFPIRSAFSLLEMVLALALAMVLLLALYLTLNTYITSANIGRVTLDEGELARSIMSRISGDVANQLGATDTRTLMEYNADALLKGNNVAANVGVKGDATSMMLTVYRVEAAPGGQGAKPAVATGEMTSDVRRINYWVVMSGPEVVGLAREIKQATSMDIDAEASDVSEPEKYLITKDKEIKSVTFEYHSGLGWQADWNGGAAGAEDGTPTGPPAAIKITLVLRPRAKTGALAVETTPEMDQRLTYVHVVALSGSNNFTPKTTP